MQKIAYKLDGEIQARAFLDTVGTLTKYTWPTSVKVTSDDVEMFTYYPVWIIFNDGYIITWCEDEKDVECPQKTGYDILEWLKAENKSDPVNHPSHYTSGKVECIDAMEQVFGTEVVKHYCLGACFKYLWRRKLKENEEQDIKKSLWYFDKFKELINK